MIQPNPAAHPESAVLQFQLYFSKQFPFHNPNELCIVVDVLRDRKHRKLESLENLRYLFSVVKEIACTSTDKYEYASAESRFEYIMNFFEVSVLC